MSAIDITCKTLSVPEAGRLYYGLSRNGAYDAAKRGEIPVIKVGRRYRVPIAAMERLLDSVSLKPAMTP
jgi:excisionase family DNA binding protein